MTVGARRKLKIWFGRFRESFQNSTRSMPRRSGPEGEVAAVPDAVGKRRLRSKSAKERGQLLWARVLMLLLGLYLASLVVALVVAVAPKVGVPKGAVGVLVAFTSLGIWKSKEVRALADAAIQSYCVSLYLDAGHQGDRLRAPLARLVDGLLERRDISYNRIDIVAYSFGTIVAIDALFPYQTEPPRRFENVSTLVTIACPFDFIRTYWPDYFAQRFTRRPDAPLRWINIYAPMDVMASNFRDDTRVADAEITVGVRKGAVSPAPRVKNLPYFVRGRGDQVHALELLSLAGLRVHGEYWSPDSQGDPGVFGAVVEALFFDSTCGESGSPAAAPADPREQ
jgi:hypothetical protein